jgi:hypothetical protein
MHSKELLGDMGHVESCSILFVGGDEDINTTPTPGPITHARARQLNHQVSSFLNSCPSYLDNGDACTLVLLRNDGEDQKGRGLAPARFGLQDSTNL